jgi:hypothetical protein
MARMEGPVATSMGIVAPATGKLKPGNAFFPAAGWQYHAVGGSQRHYPHYRPVLASWKI